MIQGNTRDMLAGSAVVGLLVVSGVRWNWSQHCDSSASHVTGGEHTLIQEDLHQGVKMYEIITHGTISVRHLQLLHEAPFEKAGAEIASSTTAS